MGGAATDRIPRGSIRCLIILLRSTMAEPQSDSDRALWDALVAANQKGTELFAHQDLKGLVAHYTADATVMFPGMDVIQGRDGIEQQLGKFYEVGATEMVLETKEVGSLGASDEMAFERGYNRVVSDDGQLLVNGKYVTLWKKLEGQWFVYCSIYTSNT